MSTAHGGQPSQDGHYEVERKLVDAEIDLAEALEDLGRAETRMGLRADADHRLQQAAELERRAKEHADHLRSELEEEEKRDKDSRPPRR
jgi:hypothetical protein